MELFSLLAKLTLDATDFDKALSQAEQKAGSIDLDEPELGLDTSDFDSGIDDANSAEVDDLDSPELGLDDADFDSGIDDANDAEVDDPDTPSLDLDTSDFEAGVSQAESTGSQFGSIMSEVFENIKGALVTTGIVGAVTGIVTSLKEGVALAGKTGDAIDKQSQKMNLSAKAYQEWNYALGLSGASIDDLNRGLRTWQQSAGDEKKAEELGAAFEALGIDAGNAMDAIERAASGHGTLDSLLNLTMGKLADYSGGDKGYLVSVLFGKNANGLNALLNSTSSEIADMRQEANDLGLIMTDEEVKNAAAYMDATSRLEQSIQGLKTSFVADLMPVITDAVNGLAKIVAFFNPRNADQTLSSIFKDTDKELSKDLVTIEGTGDAAMEMVDKLLKMGDAQKLNAEQQAEWKSTAQWLIEKIPSLSGVIDTDTLSINGNKEAITANINEWKRLATQRAITEAKERKYQAMLETNAEVIDAQATARARANDAQAKENERVAEANRLLRENQDLATAFSGAFGETQVSKGAENYQKMMEWLEDVGFEFADTTNLLDLAEEYNTITKEQRTAESEAAKYGDQLEKAQAEYDSWVQAIEEMYGTAGETATDATSDVDALNEAINKLPNQKLIHIGVTGFEKLMGRAIGDKYVPFDMPVMVHRGEEIRTATAVRRDRGTDLSGLEDRIEAAIRAGMENATVNSFINGRRVTDDVNRDQVRRLKARRFAP